MLYERQLLDDPVSHLQEQPAQPGRHEDACNIGSQLMGLQLCPGKKDRQ